MLSFSVLARAIVLLVPGALLTAAAVLPSPGATERGVLPITQYPGANLLAKTYPNDITARYNNSVWILPASKTAVAALLPAGQKLLPSHPVPGLASNEWPLILQSGLDQEVKQYGFSIGDFYTARVSVSWMDKSGDGVTPFSFHFKDVMSLAPLPVFGAAASGAQVIIANFTPDVLVFQGLGNGQYGQAAKKVGGEPLFDIRARDATASDRKYAVELFKDFTNQGYAKYAEKCIFHATTYDLPLTLPTFIEGNVTLSTDLVPAALARTYPNVQGLRAAEHFLEMLNQPCVGRAKFPPSQ